jgi:hypothetical protein
MGKITTTTKIWTEIINERDTAQKELKELQEKYDAYKQLVFQVAHIDHALTHQLNYAVEALKEIEKPVDTEHWTGLEIQYQVIARRTLAEIEKIGNIET